MLGLKLHIKGEAKMKQNRVKVLVKYAGKKELEVKEVKNKLSSYQSIVDGYIELPYVAQTLRDCGIDVIINDSGKNDNLPISVLLVHDDNVYDYICGNVIFVGHDGDGNFRNLTNEQVKILDSLIDERTMIHQNEDGTELPLMILHID